MLDGIHEDLNRVPKKPYIEDVEGNGVNDEANSVKAWHNYLLRDKSVIVDIFQGQLRNTLKCLQCGHCSVKFDPFMYLSIPISEGQQNMTLDDCIESFCKEELLTGDNQWYCSKCKKHVNATKKFDLWTLPPILIVHLKRFKHHPPPMQSTRKNSSASSISWMSRGNSYYPRSRVTKLNHKVDFPLQDWRPSIALARTVHEPSYDLYAVSNHFGGFGSGHYTAYAMNRIDDEWYEFNDSNTRRITEREIEKNSNAAYLLFYNLTERCNKSSSSSNSIANSVESPSFINRVPVIYQQSISRPEYWPHHKTFGDDECLRLYKRPLTGQSKLNVSMSDESDDLYVKDHTKIFQFEDSF